MKRLIIRYFFSAFFLISLFLPKHSLALTGGVKASAFQVHVRLDPLSVRYDFSLARFREIYHAASGHTGVVLYGMLNAELKDQVYVTQVAAGGAISAYRMDMEVSIASPSIEIAREFRHDACMQQQIFRRYIAKYEAATRVYSALPSVLPKKVLGITTAYLKAHPDAQPSELALYVHDFVVESATDTVDRQVNAVDIPVVPARCAE